MRLIPCVSVCVCHCVCNFACVYVLYTFGAHLAQIIVHNMPFITHGMPNIDIFTYLQDIKRTTKV